MIELWHLRYFLAVAEELNFSRAAAMIELYPDRVNPGSLWGGANAAKSELGAGAKS